MKKKHQPPGPKGDFLLGNLRQFRRGFLPFMRASIESYGDIVHFRIGLSHIYLVNHPDYIHEVLVAQANKFNKSQLLKRVAGTFIGNGLIVSNGDVHKQQRRLMQPAFHSKRIDKYAQIMVDYSLRMLDGWHQRGPLDIEQEMVKVTSGIVAKTLFDADVSDVASRVHDAMTALQNYAIKRFASPIPVPDWLPTPRNIEKRRAVEELDKILMQIIEERRALAVDKGDLLSMLLLAVDEENGVQMSNQQVRDEALTLFLAGHETTSNALTWTWYLLSQNPEIEAKVVDEVKTVLGGRLPTLKDLPQLQYTEMVFSEAMRLYPPVWILSRQATTDVEVGDYMMQKGSTVFLCALITQRDARYFEEPEKFIPERFAEEQKDRFLQDAYFPFGDGPRICIGNAFALMAAKIILATTVQRYHLSLVPGQEIVPQRLATLRPKYGLQMNAHARVRQDEFLPYAVP